MARPDPENITPCSPPHVSQATPRRRSHQCDLSSTNDRARQANSRSEERAIKRHARISDNLRTGRDRVVPSGLIIVHLITGGASAPIIISHTTRPSLPTSRLAQNHWPDDCPASTP
ncbi:hypothetical protein FRC12_020425, partial [Ceratobasidium sp. 428]